MTHPTEEQWMSYLYGELERKSQAALAEHLRSCPECRTQVTAWSDAKESLDGWRLSEVPAARANLRPLVKWTAAAALLVAVAFATGRLTSTRRADARLRGSGAGTAAELDSLRADLRDLHKKLEEQNEQLVTASVDASRYETVRLLAAFAERSEVARLRDRQMLVEALGQWRSQDVREHAALRTGLEVLASLVDEELQPMAAMRAGHASAQPDSEVQNIFLSSYIGSP